uniref:Mariner Mos1 transposase n=1 Tax=Heterorhabditis bacteriophora TaxID=37862 RepID=A0A1I7XBK4_HETBA
MLAKLSQQRSIATKLTKCPKNYNVYVLHWSIEKDQFFLMTTAERMFRKLLQKLNYLGYEALPHSVYSSDFSSTDYHFPKHLDNFLQEKVFSN